MMSFINYIYLRTVNSTNTWAKAHAHKLEPFSCIVADEQTAGRGRFERQWISPAGQSVYASLFFTVPSGSAYLINVGQIMAFSGAQMLCDKGFPAEIKWPNDILIKGKKIGGVLTETLPLDNSVGVIIGIGLNVNMEKATLDQIDQPATSLLQLSGKIWDLQLILQTLMEQFLKNFELLEKEGFPAFETSFNELLAYKGQQIKCHDGTQTCEGICHSVTKDGRLRLQLPTGEMKSLSAGEFRLQQPEE
jgi:BirA family biotin operon repressor/biotin-[acetyl-CoA-carboxylase] ligase